MDEGWDLSLSVSEDEGWMDGWGRKEAQFIHLFLLRGSKAVCMFDKFHVTCNPKSKVSRDVFKNKIECQLTCTFYSKMSSQYLAYTIF
jgi:hypothetical protein